MRKGIIASALIFALFFLIAGVSAETFTATGGNGDGQYVATLCVDDNGNMALAIAGVVQGTLEPYTPSSSPLNSLVDATPIGSTDNVVYQVYTIDAENGQGFAGCSAVGAGGSTASTGASVTGGVLNVGQFAAVFSPGLTRNLGVSDFEAAAAGQAILDSYGNSVQATTQASGSNGGSSVGDTEGNGASADASVIGGTLNTGQFAAVFSSGLTRILGLADLEAAVAGQAIWDSYGDSVRATTQASGSNGGSSVVDTYVEGTLDGLLQVAGAGGGLPISAGIGSSVVPYGSIAFQAGDIGSGVVNYGSVRAVSTDSNGNRVRAYAEVSNGSIEFEQLTYGAGSLFSGIAPSSILYASEDVEVSGTQGRIATNAKASDGSTFTRSNVQFSNDDAHTGTIDAIARSEGYFSDISGPVYTESVLREWNSGDFDNFRIRAANQDGRETKSNPNKNWKAIAESTGKYNVKSII